jgi:hypothetical protein
VKKCSILNSAKDERARIVRMWFRLECGCYRGFPCIAVLRTGIPSTVNCTFTLLFCDRLDNPRYRLLYSTSL